MRGFGAAFAYLDRIREASGGLVTWQQLQSFTFEDRRILLITQRGIRTVSGLPGALSIFTTYSPDPEARPYEDELGADDFPRYKWRGEDPSFYDNVALRHSMETGQELGGGPRRLLSVSEAVANPSVSPTLPPGVTALSGSKEGETMSVDEHDRHRLFTKAIEILGEREATILMAHLPPGGWSNLATKQDGLESERRIVAELKGHTFKTVLLTNLGLATAFAVMAFTAAGLG